VRALVARGARVRAWLGPEPGPALQLPVAGVEIRYGEITDPAAAAAHLDAIDAVFHLAGPPSAAASFDRPAEYLRTHAVGTATLIERGRAAGIQRFVYVSSAEVYAAASGGLVGEDHPRAPRSPYGIAKLAAEHCVEACAPAAGIAATIVRPFSLYGPGAPAASLIATVVAQVRRGEPPVVADPRPVRDYCHVDDAADAIVRAGARSGSAPRAYNIASGVGVAVADVVRAILRAAGRPEQPIGARAADRPDAAVTLALVGDPARARDELGFVPRSSLAAGLAALVREEVA
jgi:nucleoside-diphosphate-sugar epimerase